MVPYDKAGDTGERGESKEARNGVIEPGDELSEEDDTEHDPDCTDTPIGDDAVKIWPDVRLRKTIPVIP